MRPRKDISVSAAVAWAMALPIRIVFLTYGDFYEWSFIRYEKRPVAS
jgi:hypothetical protein